MILVQLILVIQFKKADYNTNKINDHDHDKYITISEFNKLTIDSFEARLKQGNLASKTDIANFVNKIDFDNKLLSFNKIINSNKAKHILAENELNKLSEKFELLSGKYDSFFLGRIYITTDDGLQNLFVYQPKFSVLENKQELDTEYFTSCKSKVLYNYKLIAFNDDFLHNIKYFIKKIGIQFDNSPLVVEQNSYKTEIVNFQIIYDLDGWPKCPLDRFT